MRCSTPLLVFLFSCIIQLQSFVNIAEARIEKSIIKNDDRSLVPVTAAFGFLQNGVIQIVVGLPIHYPLVFRLMIGELSLISQAENVEQCHYGTFLDIACR